MGDRDARCRAVLGADDGRAAVPFDADETAFEVVDAERVPALGHAADAVVVGRSAPEREGRGCGETRMDEATVRIERDRSVEGLVAGHRVRGVVDLQLERAHLETGRRPGQVAGGGDDHGQERIAGTGGRTDPARQVDIGVLAGAERGQVERPARDLRPIDGQRVRRPKPAEVREVLVVGDLDPTSRDVLLGSADPDRRGEPLVLPHRRLRPAIRPDHPVAHEGAVVRLLAEVAAVGPARPPVRQRLDEPVIAELPDEAALQPGCRFDGVPVLGERPVAVAHRVRVLAHDQRVALQTRSRVTDDRRDRRVHRAGDVGDRLVARPVVADGALVVERPAGVVAAQPGGCRLVVEPVAGLVAERPEDDRGVVLVALGHPRDAIDPLREIAMVVAQRALEGVRLDVGLVHHVHAELVGQLEEGRIIRVVRGADRVEPELLEQDDVGAHVLAADDASGVLVEVVAVHPADVDPFAVDEQVEAADLDLAEADRDRDRLGDRAVGRAQGHLKRVEVRLLGRPAADGGHVDVPGHETVERRRHARVDPEPQVALLGREQAGRVRVHDVLDLAGPALEGRPIDHLGRGGVRLARPVERRLDRPAGTAARGPGTRP